MSGYPFAAALLALAVLIAPSAHLRLPPARRGRYAVPSRSRMRTRLSMWPGMRRWPVTLIAVVLAIAFPAPPHVGLSVALAAVVFGTRRRRRSLHRQRDTEGAAIAAALDVLTGELRVGSHPVRAFSVAAAESHGDVATALRGVGARAQLGADVTAGLRVAGQCSAVPAYWSRLAACWGLAAEHGLPIAVLMRAAQSDIAERQRFAGRINAGLAGARATAAVLAGLPVVGVAFGELLGAHPTAFLIHRGGVLLVIGVALVCVGVLWSDHIIDRVAP